VIGIRKTSKAASVCVGKITSWAIHPHPIRARLWRCEGLGTLAGRRSGGKVGWGD
jgi:hypothetical protein